MKFLLHPQFLVSSPERTIVHRLVCSLLELFLCNYTHKHIYKYIFIYSVFVGFFKHKYNHTYYSFFPLNVSENYFYGSNTDFTSLFFIVSLYSIVKCTIIYIACFPINIYVCVCVYIYICIYIAFQEICTML